MRCLQLAIEDVPWFTRRNEEVAVQPREVAFDPFVLDDSLDAIDRCRVALGSEASAFLPVQALQLEITVVEGVHQMGRRATGLSAPQRPVVQDHDRLAFSTEQISGGQAGDARPDDTYIRRGVFGQDGLLGDFGGGHPDRGADA